MVVSDASPALGNFLTVHLWDLNMRVLEPLRSRPCLCGLPLNLCSGRRVRVEGIRDRGPGGGHWKRGLVLQCPRGLCWAQRFSSLFLMQSSLPVPPPEVSSLCCCSLVWETVGPPSRQASRQRESQRRLRLPGVGSGSSSWQLHGGWREEGGNVSFAVPRDSSGSRA